MPLRDFIKLHEVLPVEGWGGGVSKILTMAHIWWSGGGGPENLRNIFIPKEMGFV